MGQTLIIIGMQWGDEGKGKIVDLICPAFDAVVRYQGGHNAGHTVRFGKKKFALHVVPSGILRDDTVCCIANDVVFSPEAFFTEIEMLEDNGISTKGRILVSPLAHVILPAHAALDEARERARGKNAIGTTNRGIGPAYEIKAARVGIRVGELYTDHFEETLPRLVTDVNRQLKSLGADPVDLNEMLNLCRAWAPKLRPYMADLVALLDEYYQMGMNILFEGAQGTLLDIDVGTYPFVTSSRTGAGAASTGSGFAVTRLNDVVGVIKAYTTRVGEGPFPTELSDDVGKHLGEKGNEFGTTTGRPRRCGWLDLVAAKHACRVNGPTSLALTKLDVLDGLEAVKICVHYQMEHGPVGGNFVGPTWPSIMSDFKTVQPGYETFPGWSGSVGITRFDQLPENAQAYIGYIEDQLGVPIPIISTGPRREETIVRTNRGLQTDLNFSS